jgi:predicted DNA-binding transcriptional regulator AlpA
MKIASAQPHNPKYLTRAQVAEMFGVAYRTIERWEQLGEFPRGFKQGPRRVFYDSQDIAAHVEARKSEQGDA